MRDLIFVCLLGAMHFSAIKGTADFVAKANPGFLEIEGKGGDIDASQAIVKDGLISGSFSADMKALKTGIDERDDHLRKYLEADKFPTATLTLREPVLIGGGTIKKFKGDFTLHGVTRPVEGTVQFSETKAEAKFTIDDITQYGIKGLPQFKLLTVGKSIDVIVTLVL